MAFSDNKLLVYSLLWVGLFVWTTVSKSCYYPDGIQATDNTPCYQNANASVGVCCGPGFTCLSNGLCQQGQYLFRGTCTDSTWKSQNCPSYCKTGQQLDNWVSSCPSLGSGYFCCGSGDACCKNSTLVLDLGPGTVVSTASSASTSTSASTTITSLPTNEITTTTSRQATSTLDSSQTTAAISPSAHDSPTHGSGTNIAVAAGVAVGVGLAGCACIVAFIFFFCRRERRRHRNASDPVVSENKSGEMRPIELELNGPRSELGSSAVHELPTSR